MNFRIATEPVPESLSASRGCRWLWLGLLALPGLSVSAPFAYVTDYAVPGFVRVIDIATNAIVGSPIPAGNNPGNVAISPEGQFVYVVDFDANGHGYGPGEVSIVDAAQRQLVASVPVGAGPTGIAVTPDGQTLYVANSQDSTVSAISTESRSVIATIIVGTSPEGVAASPTGLYVYVAEDSQQITVIGTASNMVVNTIPLPGVAPYQAVVSPDGKYLYVTGRRLADLNGPGVVLAIDTATNTIVATTTVDVAPRGIAVTPDGTRLYVATLSNTVSVISTVTRALVATISVGQRPFGVAVTPDGMAVYVGNALDGTLSAISVATNSVTDTIAGLVEAASLTSFIGPGPIITSPVIEYYSVAADHYFMTQNPGEIHDLDAAVFPGWVRTGLGFAAYLPERSGGRGSPVCRFYGLPSAGLDSHFYSASQMECEALMQPPLNQAWLRESDDVFEAALPETLTGACPVATLPVYRLWNGRIDSNHRYTTDPGIKAQMIAQGFIPEGYGPDSVAMCAPEP